jgi:hypothetical protein
MGASIAGLTTAEQAKEGKAEVDAVRVQIAVLGKAVAAYRVKHSEFPVSLKGLVEKKLVLPEAIVDPWDKEFQYDRSGKRNHGKMPDIWTVSPSKMIIGNWPEVKK